MLSVADAIRVLLSAAGKTAHEMIPIGEAAGRVLATDVAARTTQPPFAASAMDGYAVRRRDALVGASLRVIGEARAGEVFSGVLGAGEAVRIFTGGAVPPGADHIVIQEEAERQAGAIVIAKAQSGSSSIRRAGLDFTTGAVLKRAGERLSAIDLSLLAAANAQTVAVATRPTIAYFDNGDELVEPGAVLRAGEIVGSNRFAFDALVGLWGGQPLYLGRAGDSDAAVAAKFELGAGADIIVPIGGASVGDHDHGRSAFAQVGGSMVFAGVAVKPGKPTWVGRLGAALVVGLPGNPASAIVCAALFLRPLIEAMLGAAGRHGAFHATLSSATPANGSRETYLRAKLWIDEEGRARVDPFADQDSSLLLPLAGADALIRRAANAPPAAIGDRVEGLRFP